MNINEISFIMCRTEGTRVARLVWTLTGTNTQYYTSIGKSFWYSENDVLDNYGWMGGGFSGDGKTQLTLKEALKNKPEDRDADDWFVLTDKLLAEWKIRIKRDYVPYHKGDVRNIKPERFDPLGIIQKNHYIPSERSRECHWCNDKSHYCYIRHDKFCGVTDHISTQEACDKHVAEVEARLCMPYPIVSKCSVPSCVKCSS